eukprot:7493614-Pyramimonas_sp.AAC.1
MASKVEADIPRWFRMVSTCFRELSRPPLDGSKCPQSSPRKHPRGQNPSNPMCFSMCLHHSLFASDVLLRPQDGSKMAPAGPKRGPGGLQYSPKSAQDRPESAAELAAGKLITVRRPRARLKKAGANGGPCRTG